MRVAYVDTSCLVAIAFGEPGWEAWAARLETFDVLVSSNLMEVELRSALVREDAGDASVNVDGIAWILPDRRLTPEIDRVLAARLLRGADLWHLACALFLAESPADMAFVTLDERQREAAERLGFASV